jgi:hypothetical protein
MLPNSSPFVIWCRRLIEFGWLFTIILIPSYFNLLSSRHFEPDKAIVLRALVTIMASFAIIHWIYTRAKCTIFMEAVAPHIPIDYCDYCLHCRVFVGNNNVYRPKCVVVGIVPTTPRYLYKLIIYRVGPVNRTLPINP